MMTFYIIGAMYACVLLWVIYEFWRAPLVDGKGNIINKTKKRAVHMMSQRNLVEDVQSINYESRI